MESIKKQKDKNKGMFMKLSIFLGIVLHTTMIIYAQQPLKDWTFLVYIAGANDLCDFVNTDLDEMMKVGSNEYANILAFVTHQEPGGEKTTKRYVVHKGYLEEDGELNAQDSGDSNTLYKALAWALENYPSKYFALDLWNHGSGPLNRTYTMSHRGICYDDETDNYLDDNKIREVVHDACNLYRGGQRLDIISCDACLMANVEIASAFASCAKYFVASQETIPGDGYAYERVLKKFEYGSLEPEAFARAMVEAYDNTYDAYTDYTLSIVNLSLIPLIQNNVTQLSDALIRALRYEKTEQVLHVIKGSASSQYCTHFAEETYIDMYQFYENLLKYLHVMNLSSFAHKAISNILCEGLTLINACVLENVHSATRNTVRGLSIYFPELEYGIETSYYDCYWTKNTAWAVFLEECIRMNTSEA